MLAWLKNRYCRPKRVCPEFTGKYNGWTNYETWLVNLWLDNDASTYAYWLEQAQQQLSDTENCKQVAGGIWTLEQSAKYHLSNQISVEVSESIESDSGTLAYDLMQSALQAVDWDAIAASRLAVITG